MMNLPAQAADGSAAQKSFKNKTLQFLEQFALLSMIIAPIFLTFYAAIALTQGGVSWKYPVAAFLAASFVNLGTTAGFHRMLTHQSFRAHPAAQYILLILGAVAGMGSPVCWACNHIHHHSHSDTENDIHSPHTHRFEGGSFATLRRWIDAHMGWILRYQADTVKISAKARQVTDTAAARFVHKTAVLWFLAGLFLPLCFGWNAFLWLGIVRLFLNQHITYSVNSICHLWGRQPFQNTKDKSRNNALIGVAGARRRLAQQPPFSARVRPARPPARTVRLDIQRDLPSGTVRPCLPRPALRPLPAVPRLAPPRNGQRNPLRPLPRRRLN